MVSIVRLESRLAQSLGRDQKITKKEDKANSTSSTEAIAAPSPHRLAALIRPRPVRDP